MGGELVLNYEYIAAHIKDYIQESDFFDIFAIEDIKTILKYVNFSSEDFISFLKQSDSSITKLNLYRCTRKTKVSAQNFHEAISIIKSVKKHMGLNFLDGIPDILFQVDAEMSESTKMISILQTELISLKNQIENSAKEIRLLKSQLKEKYSTKNANKEENQVNNQRMNEKPKEVMNDNKENETNSPQTEEDEKLPLSFRISLARYKLSNNVEKICKFLEEVAEKGNQKMITRAIEEGLCDKFDPNGLKVIHLAGEKGNLKLVKSLIECGIDKDQLTRYGQTPLVRASAYGQLEVVKYLVSLGAEKHKDALYFAAYEGHLEVVKILVTVGKHRVNESKWGLTPIIAASQRGQLEVVKYLISVGARIQLNDYDEYSAIVWAAGNGHLEVVKYLVSIGGDYNAKEHSGRTALSVAKGKVREYLLSIGAV